MKTRKTLLVSSFILTVVIAACSKSDSSSPSAASVLIAGKWQLTDVSILVPGSSLSVSIFDTIPPCVKDNFYTFASDSTVTVDEGATKCDASDPQTFSGNWSLLSNNTKLKTIDPLTGETTTVNVVTLNSSSVVLQDTATYMGIPVNATVTLTNTK